MAPSNTLAQVALITLSGAGLFATVGFILSRRLHRNDVADSLWGLGFVLIAVFHLLFFRETLALRGVVAASCTLLWGLRLSGYLTLRLLNSASEDRRYAAMRQSWGDKEPLSALLKIFGLQAFLLSVISLPLGLVISAPDSPITAFDFLGLTLFICGFLIETAADAQLNQFKKSRKGSSGILQNGLWALCRHPNYLGEILVWWGLYALAFSAPYCGYAIISPILITFLLLKVSGVPLLEKTMGQRSEAFEAYRRSVPTLVPVRWRDMKGIALSVLILVVLDMLWLGVVMRDFYRTEGAEVLRLKMGELDVLVWPALGVYGFLALGLRIFAVRPNRVDAFLHGGFFGLCAYGIYDLTNLSLLKNWSPALSLVDIAWGSALCALTALMSSPAFSRPAEAQESPNKL